MTEGAIPEYEEIIDFFTYYPRGMVVSIHELYAKYTEICQERGQEPPTRQGLSRGLSRHGALPYTIPSVMVGSVRSPAVAHWIIPGPRPILAEDFRMYEVLQPFGSNIFPVASIHRAYRERAREKGWENPMTPRQISEWLTRNGFPSGVHKGVTERYVSQETVEKFNPANHVAPRDAPSTT